MSVPASLFSPHVRYLASVKTLFEQSAYPLIGRIKGVSKYCSVLPGLAGKVESAIGKTIELINIVINCQTDDARWPAITTCINYMRNCPEIDEAFKRTTVLEMYCRGDKGRDIPKDHPLYDYRLRFGEVGPQLDYDKAVNREANGFCGIYQQAAKDMPQLPSVTTLPPVLSQSAAGAGNGGSISASPFTPHVEYLASAGHRFARDAYPLIRRIKEVSKFCSILPGLARKIENAIGKTIELINIVIGCQTDDARWPAITTCINYMRNCPEIDEAFKRTTVLEMYRSGDDGRDIQKDHPLYDYRLRFGEVGAQISYDKAVNREANGFCGIYQQIARDMPQLPSVATLPPAPPKNAAGAGARR